MKIKHTFIYGLKEENNLKIRYIGKSDNPKKRFKQHINSSKNKKTHKDCWIASCISKNISIELIIIEKVNYNKWKIREQYWAEFYESNKLTNSAPCGYGGKSIKYKINYFDFKKWVNRKLPHIKNSKQWQTYIENHKIPKKITKYPADTYKNRGWIGWSHLLNTNNINYSHNNYITYDECKKIINKKYSFIKTVKDWNIFKNTKNFPKNFPKCPDKYYLKKNEWKCWKDFLNSDSIRKTEKHIKYLNYIDAKNVVNKIFKKKLSVSDWRNMVKNKEIPLNIPGKPDRHYKKTSEWVSWGDFLGTNSIAPQNMIYRNYYESKQYVKLLNLKNNKEWRRYCSSGNKPIDIPSSPERVYKEWENWKEWLT